jgi:putative membrane protein
MPQILIQLMKGILIGAANVVPGVSGGTMALLTGIFERLINAIDACNKEALFLLRQGKFSQCWHHIDGLFLFTIGAGVLISLFSFAKMLDWLFMQHKLYVWSLFFGLILASVYAVGKTIRKWSISGGIFFILGTITAGSMALLTPATSNDSTLYLMLCGVIAMCSMILPGLSGSFVLLLMGNYELVINAISQLNIKTLIPFGLGALLGIVLFARFLSWIYRRYHDQTVSLLTGFIFGSLALLWPWKSEIIQIVVNGNEWKEKVIGYTYALPTANQETYISIGLIVIGILLLFCTENASKKTAPKNHLR